MEEATVQLQQNYWIDLTPFSIILTAQIKCFTQE